MKLWIAMVLCGALAVGNVQQPPTPGQPGTPQKPVIVKEAEETFRELKVEDLFRGREYFKSINGYLVLMGEQGAQHWQVAYKVDYIPPDKVRIEPTFGYTVSARRNRIVCDGKNVLTVDVSGNRPNTKPYDKDSLKNIAASTVSILLRWLVDHEGYAENLRKEIQEKNQKILASSKREMVGGHDCERVTIKAEKDPLNREHVFWFDKQGIPRMAMLKATAGGGGDPEKAMKIVIREYWIDGKIDPEIDQKIFAVEPAVQARP